MTVVSRCLERRYPRCFPLGEEGAVDAGDSHKGKRRTVREHDRRVAIGCNSTEKHATDRRTGCAQQNDPVATGNIEAGNGLRAETDGIRSDIFRGRIEPNGPLARAADDGVVGAAPNRVAAAAQSDRLVTAGSIDEFGARAAGDGVVGDAADRLVGRATAIDHIACATPDGLVAPAAAGDLLAAGGAVDELVAAATARDRIADGAGDRFISGCAAGNRLLPKPAAEQFGAGPADDRVVQTATDRHIGVATAVRR
jgi:hypothetical protein